MHIRRKAWTEPQLQSCAYFVEHPRERRGHWRELFAAPKRPLELEIGCGKGVSTAQMARSNPNVNYVAIDEVRHVLAVASKNADEAFAPEPVSNLILSAVDAMFIRDSFAPEDRVSRLHISFPNPWTAKSKHYKRRLTHPRQLIQYREFLVPGAELLFKTDDGPLFEDSRDYLRMCGFEIVYETDDLHASGYAPNYVSEHEALYAGQGVPIRFLIARMADLPADFNWVMNGRRLDNIDRRESGR